MKDLCLNVGLLGGHQEMVKLISSRTSIRIRRLVKCLRLQIKQPTWSDAISNWTAGLGFLNLNFQLEPLVQVFLNGSIQSSTSV